MTILLYSLVLFTFSIYSYALIDPNITFIQSKGWEIFRENMVYLGYYRRDLSWLIYLILTILLFAFYFFLIKNYKKCNPLKIALTVGAITLISYPFLSHDFFNYMFDARILTFYGQNPYLHKAMDFPSDQWLRFMQWTHRTYPYGPVFLIITLVPSFLSLGKFVLSFIFFKIIFALFYLLAVYFLNKVDKKMALIFATHPLIIIEGLINSHNDLLAVSLGIMGIYYLLKNSNLKARVLFLLSGGIKYITFPILFLSKREKLRTLAIGLVLFIILYISFTSEIQPWYFLNIFIFLPYLIQLFNSSNSTSKDAIKTDLFLFGLLMSYYPYIRFGGWDTAEKVGIKHTIIIIFTLLNLSYLFLLNKNKFFKGVKIKSEKN